jgi:hypothetical protein
LDPPGERLAAAAADHQPPLHGFGERIELELQVNVARFVHGVMFAADDPARVG